MVTICGTTKRAEEIVTRDVMHGELFLFVVVPPSSVGIMGRVRNIPRVLNAVYTHSMFNILSYTILNN